MFRTTALFTWKFSFMTVSALKVEHRSDRRHVFYNLPNNAQEHQQQQHPQGPNQPSSSAAEPDNHNEHHQHYVPKHQADEMRPEPAPPSKLIHAHSIASAQPADFALKETSPNLGGGRVVGGRVIHKDKTARSTYDLVERMYFLYVRVVKARELPIMDITGSVDPFVEVINFDTKVFPIKVSKNTFDTKVFPVKFEIKTN